ncbi:hypothetical protein AWB78_04943 [Caballeronia calidae]|uniref:Uncharacterized protein n=1 Tax=Caballeronia calidae TaxID=1777139 RepID=A0A158DAX5_9BURK|nr:hypothetical protein [Caballeronia calidae]SAK91641.1 hypothetical protein AWB78_04943 [Caballeronia calidae]
MLTAEGADDAEVTIRPDNGGGWRIEIPRRGGRTFVTGLATDVRRSNWRAG